MKGRDLDTVVDARLAGAGHELQRRRAAPFGLDALHRPLRQQKARLQAREVDERRIDVAECVVRLPTLVEGHAALVERE